MRRTGVTTKESRLREAWIEVPARPSVPLNVELGSHFWLRLDQNVTLGLANAAAGRRIVLAVEQDSVGGRTVTFDGSFASAPTVSTTANAITWVELLYEERDRIWAVNPLMGLTRAQADALYALLSHTHSATDITSGTLDPARYSAYTDLVAESKIGTGGGQVAQGNHTHTGVYMPFIAIRQAGNTNLNSNEAVVFYTNGGAVTGTLPASPSDGDMILVKRHGTNNVTIDRNGKKIDDVAADLTLTTDGEKYNLIYESFSGSWWTF